MSNLNLSNERGSTTHKVTCDLIFFNCCVLDVELSIILLDITRPNIVQLITPILNFLRLSSYQELENPRVGNPGIRIFQNRRIGTCLHSKIIFPGKNHSFELFQILLFSDFSCIPYFVGIFIRD